MEKVGVFVKQLLLTLLFGASAFGQVQSNLELVQELAAGERFGRVVKVFEDPTEVTSISASYRFPEIRLGKDEVIYFLVPENLAKKDLSQISFDHRQNGAAVLHDPTPGLTSITVYSKDFPGDELRHWAGPSSAKFGSKFAENRTLPEHDNLYEWPRIGHKGFKTELSKELLHPQAIRVQNYGTGTVLLSKLTIEVIPPAADVYEEKIFSPKANFGDRIMEGRNYGGTFGNYPNALRLSSTGFRYYPSLSSNMFVSRNELFIALKANAKLSSFEIMCGDALRNGAPGDGELTVFIENVKSGEKRVLTKNLAVAPQSVITLTDITDTTLTPDDVLVVQNSSKNATIHIMALRLGYNNAK
jgi:hypothetical protein